MATSPYNVTPNLGANFRDPEATYYWDTISPGIGAALTNASPELGTVFKGDDGHDYIHVKATPAFAADARADVADGTFAATANASGAWQAVVAVAAGENTWMRRFVL